MRKLFLLLIISLMSLSLMAERIEESTALNVAKTIMPQSQLVDISSKTGFNNFYIFSDDNSFVIVAADDRATPILGYSNEFPFVVENMPSNINDWLLSLNEEIQYAIDNDIPASDDIRYDWDCLKRGVKPAPKNRESLEPIVATHWDQGAPYNNMCPGGSVTGCVATAMAQLMKYWEWPRQGEGSHSYYEDNYGNLYVNFANTIYDWDNMVDMPTTSSPQAQQDAVATLMYHCGVSVDMDYSPQSSGAVTAYVADALVDYFDYNSNLSIEYREDYSSSQWKNLLKSELNAGRALIYRGRSTNSGHCFICDGYDNSDNFHFNWGWSGYCDGYYAIGALNPGQGGTGSGQGTYNLDNFIIKNVQPNTPSINAPNNVSASANGRNVTVSWSSVSGAHHYKVYRDGFVINNNVTGTSFTDNNVSYGTHSYYVRSVKSNGNYSLKSETAEVEVIYTGPAPTNLTATQSGANNAQLSWTAPASDDAVLKYGDGQPSGYSYGASYNFYWGQRFTPEQLSDYAGMAITSFQTYLHNNGSYTLLIYKEVSGELQQLLSKSFSYSGGGSWKTITLDTPLVIDYCNGIIVALHNTTIDYPAPYMEYNGSGNAGLWSSNGTSFSPIDGVSWLFRTNITDGTYTYNVYRNGSQIANNVAQTSYTDQNLDYGTYEYTVSTNYYGGVSGQSNVATITIEEPEMYSVTLSSNPAGAGTTSGEGEYAEGESVTVTATSNAGYIFEKWTENGSLVSSNASYTFTITSDRNLVANFVEEEPEMYSVTLSSNPAGAGTTSGEGEYAEGESVTVTATSNAGYIFEKWTENGSLVSSNASYTFTITSDRNLVANFVEEEPEMYSVTLSSDPAGAGTTSGEGEYAEGESVTVTATSNAGYIFEKWTENGSQVSSNASYTFTITSDRNLVANFVEDDNDMVISITDINDPLCNGETDGSVTISVQGGVPPYLYRIGNMTHSTSNNSYTFDNLGAGSYDVMVTDAIGNNATTNVELEDPEGLMTGEIASGQEEMCYGDPFNTIASIEEATTGQGGLTYRWKKNGSVINNSNSYQYTPLALVAGTYTYTREVKDDCETWTPSEGEWVIVVHEIPNVTISGDNSIVIGESTTLTASGAASYVWSTGETTASITVSPTENKTYTVVGTSAGGCTDDASITVYVSPDAIGENADNNISIYPNPTDDVVNVVCKNMKDITIMSMTGQVVGYKDVDDDNAVVDMKDYPQSVYILMIRKDDGSQLRKRIIYSK